MKKTILAVGAIVLIAFSAVFFTTSGCSSDHPNGTDSTHVGMIDTAINNSYAIVPVDFTAQSQAVADTFSWKTFIAMCWPVDNNTCGPDTTGGTSIMNTYGPTVWESFLSSDQVFVAPGNQPANWCNTGNGNSNVGVPQKVLELGQKTGVHRFIHLSAKSPAEPEGLDQASGGPLVDQNGRFVRYEVRVNYDEYNYIMQKNLWNHTGQQNFVDTGGVFEFPVTPVGAMEFKAAWKIMGPGDDTTRFYCIRAIIYNDSVNDPSPGPNPVTLGLVGLHIAHKTAHQGNWVWSTFEQDDNLTSSFFNHGCDSCAVNQPIVGPQIELNPNGSPIHAPTQVTRVNRVDTIGGDTSVDAINTYFQGLLNGTVWTHYHLVSTQWLFFEHIAPKYLANSVQETYLQGPHPASYGGYPLIIDEEYYKDSRYRPFNDSTSSSCMGCHYTATASGIKSDFSFIIGDAQ